jgi:hypothetical protein
MVYPTFEKLMDLRPEGEFPPLELGNTPRGRRRIVNVTGGTVRGEKLNGQILPGGEDFALVRFDGLFEINAQMVLKTDDGALIHIAYRGMWDLPEADRERILRREGSLDVNHYYRTVVLFETSAPKYIWLNKTMAFGMGGPGPRGSNYEVYRLL